MVQIVQAFNRTDREQQRDNVLAEREKLISVIYQIMEESVKKKYLLCYLCPVIGCDGTADHNLCLQWVAANL